MSKITNKKIPESKLLKALAEVEAAVEKSDPLQAADPEGGFSTEGTPLSDAAPRGKSDAKKGGDSDDESDDDTEKAFPPKDDDDSSSEKPVKKKKDKAEKAFPPKDSDSSSDNSSSDSDSDDDAKKSFRATAEQDETIAKAIEVSDFLEAFVDQISLTMLTMTKSFQKSITDLESRLNARIDSRVSKSIALSQDFNARLAKAISLIGTTVEEQSDLVKSLANQPATQPRGRAMLSKSDVNQPPWGPHGGSAMADGSDVDFAELANVAPEKIGDWLFAKSSRNQIDPRLIMAWEANRYDVSTLPEEIQKSLANDLLK